MPAYIPITELETDPGAPGTSELWKKWRDNPIAMFEGVPGAPKLSGPAMGAFLGFYTLTNAGLTITGLDRMKVVEFDLTGSQGNLSGTRSLRVAFSNDGGATWGGAQNVYDFSTGASTTRADWAKMTFDIETGVYFGRGVRNQETSGNLSAGVTLGSTSSLTVPANCNAMRFSWNTVTVAPVRMIGRCLQGVA